MTFNTTFNYRCTGAKCGAVLRIQLVTKYAPQAIQLALEVAAKAAGWVTDDPQFCPRCKPQSDAPTTPETP